MQQETQKHFYNIGVSYVKADAKTRGKYSLSKEHQKETLVILLDAKNYYRII